MRFEGICICGYSTPIVSTPREIDWIMLEKHQKTCKKHLEMEEIIKD